MPSDSRPLVCFDVGGVLVRICRDWAEGCAAAGVEIRPFETDPDHLAARGLLLGELQRGQVADGDFHARFSALLKGTWSPEEVARIDAAWLLDPYPGTPELVRDLQDAGLETACLSNTSHGHWEALLGYEAIAALRHRHASHQMGLVKPDPAIYAAFEHAVDRTASQILFFDDLPENVEAARARGWDACRIDHAGDPAAQMRRHLQERGLL